MSRNKSAGPPIWRAIAADLRGDIAEGHDRPGDKLPTAAALAERFAVNRNTVRRALAGLVAEGLVLSIERRIATRGEAAALGLCEGARVCVYHGLFLADGQPIALVESLFPLTRPPGLDLALTQTTSVTEAPQDMVTRG